MRLIVVAVLGLVSLGSAQTRTPLEMSAFHRTIEAKQLAVTTSQSKVLAAPGDVLFLYVDVKPKAKMHVYAPEQKAGYIRIELALDRDKAFTAAKPVFPKASSYYFEPLKETFKVFDAPFRIRQRITIAPTAAMRARAATKDLLALTGTLRYQACDDEVCYRPDQVRVAWTIGLRSRVTR